MKKIGEVDLKILLLYQLAIKSDKINRGLDGLVGIMPRVFGILVGGLVLG